MSIFVTTDLILGSLQMEIEVLKNKLASLVYIHKHATVNYG